MDFDIDVYKRQGLMEAVGPSAAWHETAGELVDDDHFGTLVAILHHVFLIALVEHVRAQRLLHVVVVLDIVGVVKIAEPQQLFHLEDALFGEGRGLVLFVDGVIAGGVSFAGLFEMCIRDSR